MATGKLNELPLLFQALAGAGLFFGTFAIAVGGWFWNKIKPKLPSALQPNEDAKDAVVLSAAIADSQSISKLAGAIERLIVVLTEFEQDEVRREARMHALVGDMSEDLAKLVHHSKCVDKLPEILDEVKSLRLSIRERTIV